jgi:FkbM family methyltransferase
MMLGRALAALRKRVINRPGSLVRHAAVFAKAAASPYRFRPAELWNEGCVPAQPAPVLNVLSSDDEWQLLEISGFRFHWPSRFGVPGLRAIYREVFAAAPSNPHAFEVGRVRIGAGDWVLDGGACEGFFTAYALSRGGNVLAVEPVGVLCKALSRTFAPEVRQGRVIILRAALAASAGTSRIRLDPQSAGHTRVEGNGAQNVEAVSVDSIISRRLVPRLDFIKMDVENSEVEALRGCRRLMRASKPRLAIAVYHEIANAALAKRLVLSARPDYEITLRGAYSRLKGPLRPYMLLAH